MFQGSDGVWQFILSVLFFPTFFQKELIDFSLGTGDVLWLMWVKRTLLLLPSLATLLGCWASGICLVTLLIRGKRVEFLMALLTTWWELGRSIFYFWGGAFAFIFKFSASLLALIKFLIMGTLTLMLDVVLMPFRLARNIGENVLHPSVPWIAVVMTGAWCVLEAGIFTSVTSQLVVETLSSMTGRETTEAGVRVPLFLFMLVVVLGSYAVLSTLADTVKQKQIGGIIRVGVIEGVVMFVEVMFLYREFVDALIPWFAAHTGGKFEPGIVGILSLASLTWFGVRGISWFLFASHGTPTLLAVIRGSGVRPPAQEKVSGLDQAALNLTVGYIDRIKKEVTDIMKRGDDVLAAFLIPPVQILAAAINFGTLLLSGQHLFALPFKNLEEVMTSGHLLHNVPKVKAKNGRGEDD